MRVIEISVTPLGEVKIDAKGFVGSECTQRTEKYERAMGVCKSRSIKPEMYQENDTQLEIKA